MSNFQPLKGFLADYMFDPAGIPFRRFGVYAGLDQPVGKEAMLFVGGLGNLTAEISQVQEVIYINE